MTQDKPLSNNVPKNLFAKKPLGEILVEAGLVSIHQIEIALREQKQYDLTIGEILASHGWIKQETADFFVKQWSIFLQKKQRRPLTLYLHAASLIDKKQLLALKIKQKQISLKTPLHSLAVEEGYVSQETVDFFFRYLFEIHTTPILSFTKPYEIIKNYINGETNFQNKELSQARFNGVNLKNAFFDGSNFRQANLTNSNLSNSSFIKANFTLANLELANLTNANFKQACLIETNFYQSNLEGANFQGANLQEANLIQANLLKASFAGADLRGAKLLSSPYSYDVYYNNATCFDPYFNPIQAGWKLIN